MILDKEKSERGSAFILALMVVAAVGLLVVPVIYLASSGLRATNLAEQRFMERYAADAGVEQGIWLAEDNPPPPPPGSPVKFSSTFNDLVTDIEVSAVGFPDPMYAPDPWGAAESEQAKAQIINLTVQPNYVAPCDPDVIACPKTPFIYTMFIQNYGGATLQIERFGVCLPATTDFTFEGMLAEVVTLNELELEETHLGVEDLIWKSGSELVTVPDLTKKDVPTVEDPPVNPPVIGNGLSPPIIEPANTDLDPECGPDREQVQWIFAPSMGGEGWVHVESGFVARVSFMAKATLGLPEKHYSRPWIKINSETEYISPGETSPVHVVFPEYNISSSAGGTTVNARATVWQDSLGNQDSYILSWQVE